MRIHIRNLASAALLALVSTFACAWGNDAHLAINRIAAQKIPSTMPQFLKANADRISYLGMEPDRWRDEMESTLKYAQEPEHFMNLELVEWLQPLPKDRFLFINAVCEHRAEMRRKHFDIRYMTPEKIGFQPYAAIEYFDRLKVAFREYRKAQKEGRPTRNAEAAAIQYAGLMGHYVADASNPLHTTIKYNGWTGPNQNGYTIEHDIHSKIEGSLIGRILERGLQFSDLIGEPKKLEHPFEDYLAYMRESNSKVENVYRLEKARGFEGNATPEAREFLRQQLGRGAQMLLNLWYTAWVDSARQTLSRYP